MIGPAEPRGRAGGRARQARQREVLAARDRAIRFQASHGMGTRQLARSFGLSPRRVREIIAAGR